MFRAAAVFCSLLLPICAVAAECPEEQVVVSTTPVVEQNPGRFIRAKQQQRLQVPAPSVLIVGDSIAENWGIYLKRDFPGVPVQNFGVGGDKTQETRWRISNSLPGPMHPTHIIVILGTNNLSDRTASVCGIVSGIMANIADLKMRWPNAFVYLFPILPRGESFLYRDEDRREINADLRTSILRVSRATLVEVPEKLFTCNWNSQECGNYSVDRLHPSAAGYKILAEVLKDANLSAFPGNAIK